jgi:hypothetical protein
MTLKRLGENLTEGRNNMGLNGGVHIDAIVERLAEMFVGMLEPRGLIE